MAAEPAAVARATAGIIATVCVLIQIQVWTGFLGDPVREARAAVAVAGDGIQLVKVKSDALPRQLQDFYAAIAPVAQPLELVNSPTTRSMRITGSCVAAATSLPTGVLLAYPETEGGRSSVSTDLLQACAVGIGVLAVAVYLWADLRRSRWAALPD